MQITSVVRRGISIALLSASVGAVADTDVPDCAHWTSGFITPAWDPHARVNVEPGTRLPVFARHPALCDERVSRLWSPLCVPQTQLDWGDPVVVGPVCGDYAYVARATGPYPTGIGWVSRDRLKPLPRTPEMLEAREHAATLRSADDLLRARIAAADLGDTLRSIEVDGNERAAFAAAIVANRSDVVAALLARGFDAKAAPDACEMLMSATQSSIEILRLLLRAGIDANCRATSGVAANQRITPLKAAASTHRRAAPAAVMAGFLYNPSPEPVAAVKALLDAGARVDEVDVWGGTALRSALGSNNVDVAQVLLDAGADVNNYIDGPMGDSHGNTLLAEAVFWYSLTNDPTMIALLLERGADVNYRSPSPFRGMCGAAGYPECTFEGQTALTRAAANGLYDVVRLLLDHGADPNLSRRDGETAAALARAYRHPDVAVMIDRYAAGVSRAR